MLWLKFVFVCQCVCEGGGGGGGHLRKPRVLTPLRSLRKERSGVSTLGLRRWGGGGGSTSFFSYGSNPPGLIRNFNSEGRAYTS